MALYVYPQKLKISRSKEGVTKHEPVRGKQGHYRLCLSRTAANHVFTIGTGLTGVGLGHIAARIGTKLLLWLVGYAAGKLGNEIPAFCMTYQLNSLYPWIGPPAWPTWIGRQ